MSKFNMTLEDLKKKVTWETSLTPIAITPTKKYGPNDRRRFIVCQCKCGTIKEIVYNTFIKGYAISCGRSCIYRKHRSSRWINQVPKIRDVYRHMRDRCYNPKNSSYKTYGERGVKVCDEWLNDYQKFLDWCLANGWKEGLQLDKDIKGNGLLYSPDTCIFVTLAENNVHKSNTIYITMHGKVITIKEGAQLIGMEHRSLRQLIKRNGFTKMEDVIGYRLKTSHRKLK